jgi:hypothetical protein
MRFIFFLYADEISFFRPMQQTPLTVSCSFSFVGVAVVAGQALALR